MTTTPSIALSSAARQLVSSSGRVKTMFNISATGAAFLPELNSQARMTPDAEPAARDASGATSGIALGSSPIALGNIATGAGDRLFRISAKIA
jgi:hypothetical protein